MINAFNQDAGVSPACLLLSAHCMGAVFFFPSLCLSSLSWPSCYFEFSCASSPFSLPTGSPLGPHSKKQGEDFSDNDGDEDEGISSGGRRHVHVLSWFPPVQNGLFWKVWMQAIFMLLPPPPHRCVQVQVSVCVCACVCLQQACV